MDSKVIKILRDLQYRIEVSDESDPERANAIRLRDRLIARYGITLDEVTGTSKMREFGYYTRKELQVVVQYFYERLHLTKDQFDIYSYKGSRNKYYYVETVMDDAMYDCHSRILRELMIMYRSRKDAYEKKLKQQLKKQMEAWSYMFLQEADLLSKPSDENKGKTRKPSFDWGDAMQAAKDLEGVVFPQNFVEQKQKAIAQG